MPAARWPSSQRPLFVRTVWVNGFRHALLAAEDQPHPAPPCHSPAPRSRPLSRSLSHHQDADTCCCDQLAQCLVKLQLVLANSEARPQLSREASHKSRKARHKRYEREEEEDEEEEESRRMSVARAAAAMIGHYAQQPDMPDHRPSSSEEEAAAVFEDEAWLVPRGNPLSERVLQWLDLAGRGEGQGVNKAPHRPHNTDRDRDKQRRVSAVQERRNSSHGNVATPVVSCDLQAVDEPLRVTARGMRARRKRPLLADNMPTSLFRHTPPPHPPPPLPPPPPPVSKRSAMERGRPQLHIFMPPLPRDATRVTCGDTDSVSECDTQWGDR